MASLRAFQSEIDEIRSKNIAEQRLTAAQAQPSTDKKPKLKDAPDAPKPAEEIIEEDEDLAEIQVYPLFGL